MKNREDQSHLKEVLKETIKLLCKNSLTYNKEFSVEGLLGITLDNEEVILVSINETLACGAEKQSSEQRRAVPSTECQTRPLYKVDIPSHSEPDRNTYASTSPKLINPPYSSNSYGRRTMGYTYSGLKKIRQKLMKRSNQQKTWCPSNYSSSPKRSGVSNTNNTTDSSYSNQCIYPITKSQNELGLPSSAGANPNTSGEQSLQRLADCVGRITKDTKDQSSLNTVNENQAQSRTESMIIVKKEILNETDLGITMEQYSGGNGELNTNAQQSSPDEAVAGTSSSDNHGIHSNSVSWCSSEVTNQAVFPVFPSDEVPSERSLVTGGLLTSPQPLFSGAFSMDTSDDIEPTKENIQHVKDLEIQFIILLSPGCVTMPRTLCRYKRLKIGNLMHAMKRMTLPREDPLYVGEYKQISGNMKTFYKCPPDLVKDEALAKYDMTREGYIQLYYQNPRPKLGGPVNWGNYVETLMRNMPLGPQYYPLESMELSEVELSDLKTKQGISATLHNADYFNCIGKSEPGISATSHNTDYFDCIGKSEPVDT